MGYLFCFTQKSCTFAHINHILLQFEMNLLRDLAETICEKFPVTTVRLRYLLRFGRMPNLRQPKDLNEKILYMKLFTDTSQWTQMADKYKVRKYVESCGLSDILIPLYGAWERVEDIPFEKLPKTFMLKANNGDGKGTNIKIDKSKMSSADWQLLRNRLHGWLTKKHIGALSGEPQYRNIKPMIIAEEVLPCNEGETSLIDYKLWCFNGNPHSFLICSERKEDGFHTSIDCYDLDWHRHSENIRATSHVSVASKALPRPECLDKIIDTARILSKPFPEVRVDLYAVNNKVYFGELTFTSLGGMMNYYTPEYLEEMGEMVN